MVYEIIYEETEDMKLEFNNLSDKERIEYFKKLPESTQVLLIALKILYDKHKTLEVKSGL